MTKSLQRRKLFVKGLPQSAREMQIWEFFGRFGKVDRVQMGFNNKSNKFKGIAYIVMGSLEAFERVLAAQPLYFGGSLLEISQSKPIGKIYEERRFLNQGGGPVARGGVYGPPGFGGDVGERREGFGGPESGSGASVRDYDSQMNEAGWEEFEASQTARRGGRGAPTPGNWSRNAQAQPRSQDFEEPPLSPGYPNQDQKMDIWEKRELAYINYSPERRFQPGRRYQLPPPADQNNYYNREPQSFRRPQNRGNQGGQRRGVPQYAPHYDENSSQGSGDQRDFMSVYDMPSGRRQQEYWQQGPSGRPANQETPGNRFEGDRGDRTNFGNFEDFDDDFDTRSVHSMASQFGRGDRRGQNPWRSSKRRRGPRFLRKGRRDGNPYKGFQRGAREPFEWSRPRGGMFIRKRRPGGNSTHQNMGIQNQPFEANQGGEESYFGAPSPQRSVRDPRSYQELPGNDEEGQPRLLSDMGWGQSPNQETAGEGGQSQGTAPKKVVEVREKSQESTKTVKKTKFNQKVQRSKNTNQSSQKPHHPHQGYTEPHREHGKGPRTAQKPQASSQSKEDNKSVSLQDPRRRAQEEVRREVGQQQKHQHQHLNHQQHQNEPQNEEIGSRRKEGFGYLGGNSDEESSSLTGESLLRRHHIILRRRPLNRHLSYQVDYPAPQPAQSARVDDSALRTDFDVATPTPIPVITSDERAQRARNQSGSQNPHFGRNELPGDWRVQGGLPNTQGHLGLSHRPQETQTQVYTPESGLNPSFGVQNKPQLETGSRGVSFGDMEPEEEKEGHLDLEGVEESDLSVGEHTSRQSERIPQNPENLGGSPERSFKTVFKTSGGRTQGVDSRSDVLEGRSNPSSGLIQLEPFQGSQGSSRFGSQPNPQQNSLNQANSAQGRQIQPRQPRPTQNGLLAAPHTPQSMNRNQMGAQHNHHHQHNQHQPQAATNQQFTHPTPNTHQIQPYNNYTRTRNNPSTNQPGSNPLVQFYSTQRSSFPTNRLNEIHNSSEVELEIRQTIKTQYKIKKAGGTIIAGTINETSIWSSRPNQPPRTEISMEFDDTVSHVANASSIASQSVRAARPNRRGQEYGIEFDLVGNASGFSRFGPSGVFDEIGRNRRFEQDSEQDLESGDELEGSRSQESGWGDVQGLDSSSGGQGSEIDSMPFGSPSVPNFEFTGTPERSPCPIPALNPTTGGSGELIETRAQNSLQPSYRPSTHSRASARSQRGAGRPNLELSTLQVPHLVEETNFSETSS